MNSLANSSNCRLKELVQAVAFNGDYLFPRKKKLTKTTSHFLSKANHLQGPGRRGVETVKQIKPALLQVNLHLMHMPREEQLVALLA